MAKNGGNGHAAAFRCTQRINVVQFAKISRDLAGFFIYLVEIIGVLLSVLTDLKLNPAVVAASLFARAAAPGPVIPGHGLNGGDGSIGQFADPAIHARFPGYMVPVVVIGVSAQLFQPFRPVRSVITGLDKPFEIRIIAAGVVPQHTLDGKDYDLIVEPDASADYITETDPLRIADNHSQGNTQDLNKSLKKAKRRPGAVFLQTYVPRIAMKKIGSDGVCEVFSNGYAIYDNGDRKTVVWVPKCGSTTYYFTKLREHELEYQNEKETIGEDVLGPLPWYMALAIAGENQIEANLERPKSYGTSSDSDDDDEPLKPATHWVAGTRFDNPEDALLRKENIQEVRAIIPKLTKKQQEAYRLCYEEGMTLEEAGNFLGIDVSAIWYRLDGMKKSMKNKIKKNF